MSRLLIALAGLIGVARGAGWEKLPPTPAGEFQILPTEGFGGVAVQGGVEIRYLLDGDSQWKTIQGNGNQIFGGKLLGVNCNMRMSVVDIARGTTNVTFGAFDSLFRRSDCNEVRVARGEGIWLAFGQISHVGSRVLLGKDTVLPDGSESIVWARAPRSNFDFLGVGVSKAKIYALLSRNSASSYYGHELMLSTDTCKSWTSLGVKSEYFINRGDTILACHSNSHKILVSLDGGVSWDSSGSSDGVDYYGMELRDGNLYAWTNIGDSSYFFSGSADFGKTWVKIPGMESAPSYSGKKFYGKIGSQVVVSVDGLTGWVPVIDGFTSYRAIKLRPYNVGFLVKEEPKGWNKTSRLLYWSGREWKKLGVAGDIEVANNQIFGLTSDLLKYDIDRDAWDLQIRSSDAESFESLFSVGDSLGVVTSNRILSRDLRALYPWQSVDLPKGGWNGETTCKLVGYLSEENEGWNPVCVMAGIAYGLRKNEWRMLSDLPKNLSKVLPVGITNEYFRTDVSRWGAFLRSHDSGAKLISGNFNDSVDLGKNDGMCKYRDSVLAWGSKGVFVASGDGIRRVGNGEFPANPRLVEWLLSRTYSGVWMRMLENTLVVQDVHGDYWYQTQSDNADVKKVSGAKPNFSVHGRTLSMEFDAASRVWVDMIDMKGRRTEVVPETVMNTGVRSLLLPKASEMVVLRVTINGESTSRMVATGGGLD